MKKNILFHALMGAVIATMASCSHDSNEVLADAQKKPVTVEVSMADAATRVGYEQGAFPTDLKIGMCFNYNDANEDTYESIISYKGGWVLTPQIYWPDYTSEIPYYAYAPYDESKTYNYGRVIHSVETDQTSLEKLNKSDLLIAQGAKKNTDAGILQLEFTHAHALLTMSFNVTDCMVTSVSIPNVAASIEDNIEDGTTEIAPQSETIYCYEEGDNKFCCFIPAQTIESDFRIMVTLSDGRELTYTHPEAITFTRNRITNFSLNVLEEISISSVTVEDWKDGGTIDADQATEPEATYSIDGSTMTVTVDAYTGSFNKALNEAIKQGCETMIVNGTLTARQQTVLANTLLGYEGEVILNDMSSDDVSSTELKNIVDVYAYEIKTENDVTTYEVYTAGGLYAWNTAVQNDKTLHLTLMADITLPNKDLTTGKEITVTDDVPSGSNWKVVGDSDNPYTGAIDGNEHSITGLCINSTLRYTGLIGCAMGATISDLSLKDIVFYSNHWIGGIASKAEGCTISNCHVSGSIMGGNVGGIVELANSESIIRDCTNSADLVGENYAGGVVSSMASSVNLINCVNYRDVSISADGVLVGGVAAMCNGNVIACMNYGNVTADANDCSIGGIIGNVGTADVIACGNAGTVTATGETEKIGGILGSFQGTANHISCWTTTDVCFGKPYSASSNNAILTAVCCYYLGKADDGIDGTTSVENLNDEVNTMNAAIETWNTANTDNACAYKWQVGTAYPELTEEVAPE